MGPKIRISRPLTLFPMNQGIGRVSVGSVNPIIDACTHWFNSAPSPDLYTPDSSVLTANELVNNLQTVCQSPARADPQIIGRYLSKTNSLASENKLCSRDFVQILHSLARIEESVWAKNNGSSTVESLETLLNDFSRELKRSTRFLNSLTHIDVTVGLTSLVKLRDIPKPQLLISIARSLYNEIPSRINMFDDHHFGQILNSMWRLDINDTVIAREIILELIYHRDVSMFNAQSIVVLASSISRLPLPSSPELLSLWNSILAGAARVEPHQMQTNWPNVLLDSYSFSKHLLPDRPPAHNEFVSRMIKLILKARETDEKAIVRLINTLKRIGYSEAESLRKISSHIKQRTNQNNS